MALLDWPWGLGGALAEWLLGVPLPCEKDSPHWVLNSLEKSAQARLPAAKKEKGE